MIRKLLDRIIVLTEPGLGALLSAPETQLDIGPLANPPDNTFPRIIFYPGLFEMNQSARELRSSAPRPMKLREEFEVDTNNAQGPYTLSNTPLQGSVLAKLIIDKDLQSERKRLIQEGADKDFQIDYNNGTFSLNEAPAEASHIQLIYSHVGVFTLLEFVQTFFIDVYHSDTDQISQLIALMNSIILTNQDELIEHFNITDTSSFNSGQYLAHVLLSQIDCISGDHHWLEQTPRSQLKFQVQGQLKPVKVISDGIHLIEQIRSLGVDSDDPVDIDIELG